MSRSFIKSFHRNGKKVNKSLNTSLNNNTIYEDENQFKSDRLNQTVCCTPSNISPKFYRTNSNPFPNTIKREPPIRETHKKSEDSKQLKSFGEKFLHFVRSNVKKKQSPSNDGELKQNEGNSTVPFKQVNDSIKSNEERSASQVYEKSINKHGDVVEYAVPYNERGSNELQPPANESGCFIRFEDVIDENILNEVNWNDHLGDRNEERRNIKITDLDESTDGSLLLDQSGAELFGDKEVWSELNLLEHWSRNIPQSSLLTVKSPLNKNVHIIECQTEEFQQNTSILRNTIGFPLHFSSGTFRKTPVTLRKCCPLDSASIGLVEEAIERDYDILSKVKHSNIVLLVAASFHRKAFDHMTLLLEVADYTLNYFLHQMKMTLSVNESISVVQQIASAALYLQESGYIHSNISSHNILVRKDPWCVKLSSFELTTEVDFADTRIDILVKYRQKLPPQSLVSDCIDLPKYTTVEDKTISLKEKYQQMSKLLPTLICSHDTPHEYLNMMPKYLMYDSNYRQHLSLHNFQAPELITTKLQFVFPTKKADVYSLCLLLWELLNKCVPFVVYSKLDMEKLITKRNLNLPFFERKRCESFMDIFRVGLAVNPEDRSIDVEQLITLLDDVKHRIRFGVKSQNESANSQLSEQFCEVQYDVEHDHERNLEDTPPRSLFKTNTHKSTLPSGTTSASILARNDSECTIDFSILSPNSLDFNRSLNENQLTSTREKRKKSPQKNVNKNICRQLFKNSPEATSTDCSRSGVHSSPTPLNENIDADRDHSLDNIEEESQSENAYGADAYGKDSIITEPLLVNEDKPSSKMLIEEREPTLSKNVLRVGHPEDGRISPKVVHCEVTKHNSAKSKSNNNLIDTYASPSRRKFFHSNVNSSLNCGSTIEEHPLPPIARKNQILRNAWLSNKDVCSSNDAVKKELEIKNQSISMDEGNKLNISIRIVHNKVTPKKIHNVNDPLVVSRIKLSDSTSYPNDQDADSNFMIPRQPSVREKIKNFEKGLEKPSSLLSIAHSVATGIHFNYPIQ